MPGSSRGTQPCYRVDAFSGVRPSSAAAIWGESGALNHLKAFTTFCISAPEDGRTPVNTYVRVVPAGARPQGRRRAPTLGWWPEFLRNSLNWLRRFVGNDKPPGCHSPSPGERAGGGRACSPLRSERIEPRNRCPAGRRTGPAGGVSCPNDGVQARPPACQARPSVLCENRVRPRRLSR